MSSCYFTIRLRRHLAQFNAVLLLHGFPRQREMARKLDQALRVSTSTWNGLIWLNHLDKGATQDQELEGTLDTFQIVSTNVNLKSDIFLRILLFSK